MPLPTPGAPYALYANNQGVVEGELMPTGGTRRQLAVGTATQEACYVACSLAGYAVPFYFSVQTSTGACYW